MKKTRKVISLICILALLFAVSVGGGCATQAQTGAAVGAGSGALVGGLANMHGSWGATALIGAGVGAGIGYLIGNEKDKKEAQQKRAVSEAELRPLAGTTWQVINITPKQQKSYASIIVAFRPDGTIITTKTDMKGAVETTNERYRISGTTLIIYRTGYIENTKFSLDGDKLSIDFGNGSVVMRRVS